MQMIDVVAACRKALDATTAPLRECMLCGHMLLKAKGRAESKKSKQADGRTYLKILPGVETVAAHGLLLKDLNSLQHFFWEL